MEKKIVLVASGGLANRMRAVASGLTLSNDTGVPLSIIWYRDWGLNAVPADLFSHAPWMDKVIVPDGISYNLKWELPRKKNLYISKIYQTLNFSTVLVDDVNMDDIIHDKDKFRKIVKDADKSIYIYSGCPFYDFDTQFYRSLFVPTIEIKEKVEAVTRRFKDKTVGLHIRRTDNLLSRKHSPDYLFEKEVDRLLEKDSCLLFYLASDDSGVKQSFEARYGEKMIVSKFSSDRGSRDGIKDAFAELLVLSRCNLLLGSWWSSYSMSAPLLGDVELRQLKV